MSAALKLSEAACFQLALMLKMGAVDQNTAVDRRVCEDGSRHLDMSVIARLSPKGLVQNRVIPANYGEPRRSLYWLTSDGLKLARQMRPAP